MSKRRAALPSTHKDDYFVANFHQNVAISPAEMLLKSLKKEFQTFGDYRRLRVERFSEPEKCFDQIGRFYSLKIKIAPLWRRRVHILNHTGGTLGQQRKRKVVMAYQYDLNRSVCSCDPVDVLPVCGTLWCAGGRG